MKSLFIHSFIHSFIPQNFYLWNAFVITTSWWKHFRTYEAIYGQEKKKKKKKEKKRKMKQRVALESEKNFVKYH